jgi:phosphohistidine phosphatase SixA
MGTLILVRHASAGERADWTDDDRLRPLDARGREQAAALAEALAALRVDRILTSPFLRCVETVEPLADARGLVVEKRDELAEGADDERLFALLHEVQGEVPLLCTHGDIVELVGGEMKKGDASLVHWSGDHVRVLEKVLAG